jgi:glyoxylase I family protein
MTNPGETDMSGASQIHHVSLMVTDLEKADDFYGDVLKLRRLPRPDFPSKGLWFEVGSCQLHVILTDQTEASSARHTAFVVDDLQAVVAKIEDRDLPIWSDIPLDGWERKHCHDPFGNGIELLQPIESDGDLPNESSTFVDETGRWRTDEQKLEK